jgi:hypothetical protein
LFCITTDNASNNGKMMKRIGRHLKDQGLNWKPAEHHVACLNHVINLAVQAFLKSIKGLAPHLEDGEIPHREEDTESDDDDDEMLPDDDDGFTVTLMKIQTITKVREMSRK